VEASRSLRSAPRLRHQDVVAGTLALAAVREVGDEELILNLPFNLVGYCGRSQALERTAEGSEQRPLALGESYRPGQLVAAVVTAVVEVGSTGRQRIEVSLRPALLNAGLTAETVVPNMWLPAAVTSEEEHVFRLSFGIEGLQGLLKKADAPTELVAPCVGVILQVAVTSVNQGAGIARCTTAVAPALPSEPLKMESLKAGFLVRARVDRILTAGSAKKDKGSRGPEGTNQGLVVNFCGALNGVIHWHHQGRGLAEAPEVKHKQRLAARVLAVIPGPQVTVHLTLLPHILDWMPQRDELSKIAVGERLDGKALDSVPKYGVRVRCVPQGGGKVPVLGFCPGSRLADKDSGNDAEAPAAGATFPCRVLGYNFLEAVAIVTRRPYDLREDILVSVTEMAAGQLVTGEISRVAEFGIFVKLSEYVTGLVHLRHLTDVPLATVPKKFQVGSKAKCRVLRVLPEKRQVSLTMKKAMVKSEFQLSSFEQARQNMLLTGYVSNVKPYGAIVSFFGNVYGLIPAKEMELDEAPALGMSVQCRVESVYIKRKRIGLSLNLDGGKSASELAGTPAWTPRSAPPEGATPGVVVAVTRLLECTEGGMVVSFGAAGGVCDLALRGFVPLAHLADDAAWATARHAELKERLQKASNGEAEGVEVEERGVVLATRFNPTLRSSKEGNKDSAWYVLLSCKPSLYLSAEEGAFVTELSELQPSRLYTGYVKEVHHFGALVSAGSWKLAGVAPKHQIASHFVEKPSEELSVGQTVRMLLTQVDTEKQRFTVDLRPGPITAASAPLLRREAEALRLMLAARAAAAAQAASEKPELCPGAVLDATVSAVKDYGVLLKLVGHADLTALVLKENMPAAQALKQGEALRCALLDFDPASGIVDASLQPELVAAPPLEPGSLLDAAGKKSKKRKADADGGVTEPARRELAVMPALQKPAYSVVWAKDPPVVLFTPPFGQRRWQGARASLLHSAAGRRLVACCPLGGGESRDRPKVPRIDRPEEEIHIGSPITMRVISVKGLQAVLAAPVGLRGHVHATHFVDPAGEGGVAGSGGENPLEDLKKRGLVEARVLSIQQKGQGRTGKAYNLELTCRPSLLRAGQDASAYEKAVTRWSTLAAGKLVPAVVSEVRRSSMWLEVAPGVRGKVSLLDASAELPVVRALSEHFTVGQVFQARVVRCTASQKKLDLALYGAAGAEQTPKEGQRVLARLEHIEDVAGKGIAASFRLPGRRRGVVHVTELFDFWARLPLKRLKVGTIYETAFLGGSAAPDARLELSLRASLVHGRAEGPDERRPMAAGDLKVGQKVSGYVVNSGPKGVFVALSRQLTARIRLKALSDQVVMKDSIAKLHPPGELIRDAVVVEVDAEQGRAELSLRKGTGTGAGGTRLSLEQLAVGDVVAGRVKAIEKYGLFLRVDNSSLDALVHRSEISDTASVSLDSYQLGSRISRAKVLKIENGKVWLGLKPSHFAEDELDEDEDDEDDDREEEAAADAGGAGGGEAASVLDAFSGGQAASASSAAKAKKRKREEKQEAAAAPAADSDEEAPWESAAAARDGAAEAAGFDWPELALGARAGSDDDSAEAGEDSEGAEADGRPSKRQKRALKKAEAKELAQREAENAEGRWASEPRTVEDFERLLLTQGGTSIVWIRYMAFHLKMSDLERARQVAERAVKHVGFSEAKERFNSWVAYMNLECTFGTDETAEAVFRRAASHNEAKHVYLQYARIHQRNKKPQLATKALDTCCKKYPQSKKVWIAFLTMLYEENDLEGARKMLPKALAALPRKKHPLTVSKAGMLEYQQGSVERGRSIFEGLMDSYPKRTDLWSVYLDAHIAAHTPPRAPEPDLGEVRSLMERCCSMRLKAMKMRFFFKRWLDFEKKWGDAESQETGPAEGPRVRRGAGAVSLPKGGPRGRLDAVASPPAQLPPAECAPARFRAARSTSRLSCAGRAGHSRTCSCAYIHTLLHRFPLCSLVLCERHCLPNRLGRCTARDAVCLRRRALLKPFRERRAPCFIHFWPSPVSPF
ncbi:unnamed protein product, partial [Prorocentrum cordatum]